MAFATEFHKSSRFLLKLFPVSGEKTFDGTASVWALEYDVCVNVDVVMSQVMLLEGETYSRVIVKCVMIRVDVYFEDITITTFKLVASLQAVLGLVTVAAICCEW